MYVLAIEEPLEIQLAGLSRLVVGGYLARQGGIVIRRARFDGCFKHPRNLRTHGLSPLCAVAWQEVR
jgi:hypothetical protein